MDRPDDETNKTPRVDELSDSHLSRHKQLYLERLRLEVESERAENDALVARRLQRIDSASSRDIQLPLLSDSTDDSTDRRPPMRTGYVDRLIPDNQAGSANRFFTSWIANSEGQTEDVLLPASSLISDNSSPLGLSNRRESARTRSTRVICFLLALLLVGMMVVVLLDNFNI
jgi:hypothetical protein